jgi:hypothetical protein
MTSIPTPFDGIGIANLPNQVRAVQQFFGRRISLTRQSLTEA